MPEQYGFGKIKKEKKNRALLLLFYVMLAEYSLLTPFSSLFVPFLLVGVEIGYCALS